MKLTWLQVFTMLVPFVSALFFAVFLTYLTLIRRRIGRAYPFYALFLASLCLFLGATILEILPVDVARDYILYIRFGVLFSIGIPSLLNAAAIQTAHKISAKLRAASYGAGTVWALLYVVVRDCVNRKEIGGWFGFSPAQIHSWNLDWQHVHFIQMSGTLILLLLPCLYFLLRRSKTPKPIGFLLSVISFGGFMMLGTASRAWWLIYTGSIVSALLWGLAVVRDLLTLRRKVANFAPWISEELLHNISSRSVDVSKLKELFFSADMVQIPNRILMVQPDRNERSGADFETVKDLLDGLLGDLLGLGQYLILPSGSLQTGICIHESGTCDDVSAVVLGERIREYIQRNSTDTVCVGIGHKCNELSDLRHSYTAAFGAVQFASQSGGNMVVTHADVQPEKRQGGYPFRERERLMKMVATNSPGLISESVDSLLAQLNIFCRGNQSARKQRIREILFMLTDAAVVAGVDIDTSFAGSEDAMRAVDACVDLTELASVVVACSLRVAEQMVLVSEINTNSVVEQARSFIAQNYHEDISVKSIAAHLSVSGSYLMSLFKKSTGKTLNQHLVEIRMEQAKLLLLSQSVTETAFAVGFNTSNYFATVFKKQTGQTPKQYQQQAKS